LIGEEVVPNFIEALESEAVEQLAALREYRTYQGANAEYRLRAKLAIGVIGAYVRLRATVANEKTNQLVEMRLVGAAMGALPAAEANHDA
jgi:hypothetical protein